MKKLFTLIALVAAAASSHAQPLSDWQFRQADGVTSLKERKIASRDAKGDRLPTVYELAKVPAKNDPKWAKVPMRGDRVEYSVDSRLSKDDYNKFDKAIDFTYFRAFLDLRNVSAAQLNSIKPVLVQIGQVDDQARAIISNSRNQEVYVEAMEGKRGGKDVTIDFSDKVVAGEVNTFFIVQVDDNCCRSNLTGGIKVTVAGREIKPDPAWIGGNSSFVKDGVDYSPEPPVKIVASNFKINAFSVNQGQDKGQWFFGVNKNDSTARIVKVGTPNTEVLNIDKVVVDDRSETYAFRVSNYPQCAGKQAFLTANPGANAVVKVDCHNATADVKQLPPSVQFVSITPFTRAPEAQTFTSFESKLRGASGESLYLRHRGFVLYIDAQHPSELFKQDASWKIMPN
ncbi:MAG: hypothetical protein JNJ71_10705 [Rubrivivax sp.]|nr:hypothetical protein [Rubrivivax sp.]